MKKKYLLVLILAFALALSACGNKVEQPKDESGKYYVSDTGEAIINDITFSTDYTTDDNARVMYEIFVGSFSDSNGDGVGDIRGIINRLDYLNDGDPDSGESLGVEGLWLTPIFKSSSYHKYNVTDFYTIDPSFGTQDDLWELLELCHDRGMIVILDLPINHTSSANQLFGNFVAAHRDGDTSNKYYEYFSYIRQGETAPYGRTYSQIPSSTDLYECNFDTGMPELNYDCEDVRTEMLAVAKHYLDLGVDGFRFDAAKYIYYGDEASNVDFWSWYIGELKKIKSDVYTVAEVWDSDAKVTMYYPALDCFDFTGSGVSGIIATSAQAGDVTNYTKYVARFLSTNTAKRNTALYMPFITNHDMDRAAGFLTLVSGRAHMAASLYILTPGSPFIYYGEEIAMKGSRGGENTDANRRLAMFWGDEDTVKDPTGATYDVSKQTNGSVADQLKNGDSLLSHYKKLIMIRKANPEIARGEYVSLNITDSKLGGFTSTWNGSSVCVLHNTSSNSTFTVDLSTVTDLSFTTINAVAGLGNATLEGTVVTVEPQTTVVLR